MKFLMGTLLLVFVIILILLRVWKNSRDKVNSQDKRNSCSKNSFPVGQSVRVRKEPWVEQSTTYRMETGSFAEQLTEQALSGLDGYRRSLRNVYLPSCRGLTELDVVLIHEKGVFVFECKDYGGRIYGSEEQQNWMHAFPNGERYQFYNPLKQNAGHCKALSRFLSIEPEDISSYVVFSDRSELMQIPKNRSMQKVTCLSNLPDLLKWDLDMRPAVFIPKVVDEIYQTLYPQTQVTWEQKKQHIEGVRRFNEGNVCPLCGSRLMLRSGSCGQVYECIRYPANCRYTRSVEQTRPRRPLS